MKKLLLSDKKTYRIGSRILKWYYRYYLRGMPSPLILAVYITNVCNLKCGICSIWRGEPKQALSLEQFKYLIDSCSDSVCYMSFSGGEPLLTKDIFKMVAYASERLPYVHMVSNGLAVTPEAVRDLKKAGLTEVSLSLDGEASWHNKTHGLEGAFDAVMNAIDCFKKEAPEITIGLDTVVYPYALEQTRKAVNISKKAGIFHKVQPVNKHFEFERNSGRPADVEFGKVDQEELKDLIDFLAKSPNIINSRYFLRRIPDYFNNRLICKPARPRCVLPYFFLEVSAFGKASPCLYATGWEGDLEVGPGLREGLCSGKFRQRQKSLESCRLCDTCLFMCYWEPLIQFPLMHSIIYGLM